jgi:hypothetical protein
MDPTLEIHRRVLVRSYRRYLAADRSYQAAIAQAATWFPVVESKGVIMIGDPGSAIRRDYERRDRALARLRLARSLLEEARLRTAEQKAEQSFSWLVRLIGHTGA